MNIRIRKPWQLAEGQVTPEAIYRSRRRFLQAAIAGAGAMGLAAGAKLFSPGGRASAAAALAPLNALRNPKYKVEGREISAEGLTAGYNNFYEFSLDKQAVGREAAKFKSRPWQVEVRGLVEKRFKFDVDDLTKRFPLEERIYRLRCVEAWSIVVPWIGIPMAKFVEWCKPTAKAKFVRMISFHRPWEAPGQREQTWYPWPYFEGLRLEEATNELTLIGLGSYGKVLPNQNGAPIRILTPWKYGYKSIKSITIFEFTDKLPGTFWNTLVPNEYDFVSNVNPAKPHPRWSQATEEDLNTKQRITTRPFNGYAEYVAHLYR